MPEYRQEHAKDFNYTLHHPSLQQRHHTIRTHDLMIHDLDTQQITCFFQPSGDSISSLLGPGSPDGWLCNV